MIDDARLAALAAQGRTTLKHEPAAVVEVLGAGEHAVVVKTYHNRGGKLLQTFWRRSRARREHDHLRTIFDAGVPCLEPLGWRQRRRLGCVAESTLVTRLLPDSRPLKVVLQQIPHGATGPVRARLAAAMGTLVGELHRRGVLWCTPMPRNVLVQGDAAAARLAVCDTPACIVVGHSLHGGRLAAVDLFLGAFSPSRRRDFSSVERWRWLLGYCAADRTTARRLWRRLTHRRPLYNVVVRALAMTWFTYILGRFRSPHRPTASRRTAAR